jgi:hypothetical protein
LPLKGRGAVEKRSSAVLRCKPNRSTYLYIRLTIQFLRALHLNIFEQLPDMGFFNEAGATNRPGCLFGIFPEGCRY